MTIEASKFLFQYCQKIILFSQDQTQVLLAKRKGEQDYDGVFSFIGGKLETTDNSFIDSLTREKNEEIGPHAHLKICPTFSYNVLFQKKDGHHMVLPHYIGIFVDGQIVINEEYSEYVWVPIKNLPSFEPKIENIPALVAWGQRVKQIIEPDEWVLI